MVIREILRHNPPDYILWIGPEFRDCPPEFETTYQLKERTTGDMGVATRILYRDCLNVDLPDNMILWDFMQMHIEYGWSYRNSPPIQVRKLTTRYESLNYNNWVGTFVWARVLIGIWGDDLIIFETNNNSNPFEAKHVIRMLPEIPDRIHVLSTGRSAQIYQQCYSRAVPIGKDILNILSKTAPDLFMPARQAS